MVDRKDSGVVNDVRSSRYDPRAQQCISVIRLAILGSHPQQREGQSESAAARRQRVLYDMAGGGQTARGEPHSPGRSGPGTSGFSFPPGRTGFLHRGLVGSQGYKARAEKTKKWARQAQNRSQDPRACRVAGLASSACLFADKSLLAFVVRRFHEALSQTL
jgi:hypothetical protein